jgi:2-iminobutanoate/2-iminopropanoate deaminase
MSQGPFDVIDTRVAPQPGGHYSQATRWGDLVFAAGQIARDPSTGVVIPGDIEAHTRRVLENLRTVLEAAGSSLDRVVRTTVFLRRFDDWERFNRVYAEFFPGARPARTTVAAELYGTALVEIDAIAVVRGPGGGGR